VRHAKKVGRCRSPGGKSGATQKYEDKMITTANINVVKTEIIGITCDKCGNKFTPEEIWEWQELYFVNFTGGYGSIFGDGVNVSAEFCQKCLKELIDPYCRKTSVYQ
jgi:hypothetical protein